jgi:16S rRNA (cytidine1402-2'-O)-methyltransferase
MIFYESPHKLLKTLSQFAEYFGGDRLISVSRELTKMYEENVRGTVEEISERFTDKPARGEIVIVVSGKK